MKRKLTRRRGERNVRSRTPDDDERSSERLHGLIQRRNRSQTRQIQESGDQGNVTAVIRGGIGGKTAQRNWKRIR